MRLTIWRKESTMSSNVIMHKHRVKSTCRMLLMLISGVCFGYALPSISVKCASEIRAQRLTLHSVEQESLYGDSRPVPGIKAFIDREDGDPESDDEEIEVQGAAQNYKDPITFGWLTKPVRR